jgi:hypothetical protein
MNLFTALAFCAFVIAAFAAIAGLASVLIVLGIVAVGLALSCLAGYGPTILK